MRGAAKVFTWKCTKSPSAEPRPESEMQAHPIRYAFIGLGNLGRRLARSLVRNGFAVTVHDLDSSAVEAFLAGCGNGSANAAATAKAAAASADAAITCLPSPAATRAVLEGDEGLLAGLRPGSAWIEMGTNDPDEVARLAGIASTAGIGTLEAPVTGGVHLASTGDITVLAGGPEALFAKHRSALGAMGNPVIHVGELGQASVMKVITNMLAFLHLLGAGEALMLARRGGINLRTAFEAIRHSSGNSFVHETESQVILNGSYDIGFTLDLACKDSGFAADLGRRFGVPLQLGDTVDGILQKARARYGGGAWSPMAVRLLEDAVGDELRAPGFPPTLDADHPEGS